MTFLWVICSFILSLQTAGPTPEQRAVDYLSQEVPAWSRDNHCFSCHNNGDGARALYVARAMSFKVPDSILDDTTSWLSRPREWDSGGDGGFSDKRLARIEYSNALIEAFDAGVITDSTIVQEAVEALVLSQDKSGAWNVDAESTIAAPARYGPVLATYMARRVLEHAKDPKLAEPIRRANGFLLNAPATAVMNAAAVVMAFTSSSDPQEKARLDQTLNFITSVQAQDGGWGPYAKTPTEVFDTAIALLALSDHGDRPGMADRIRRGRAYLISMQQEDGSWLETTRPAGGRSYAEHISTCGWATWALLKTQGY